MDDGTPTAQDEIDLSILELPFSGTREAKNRLRWLTQREAEVQKFGRRIRDEFKSEFPNRTVPGYLGIAPETGNTLLRWRLSGMRKFAGGKYANSTQRFELSNEIGEQVLATLNFQQQQRWFQYEQARIRINYTYSMIMHELHRMRQVVEHLENARKIRREAHAESGKVAQKK